MYWTVFEGYVYRRSQPLVNLWVREDGNASRVENIPDCDWIIMTRIPHSFHYKLKLKITRHTREEKLYKGCIRTKIGIAVVYDRQQCS